MRYFPYVSGEQPLNKQFLQMERHLYDTDVIGCKLRNSVVWDEGGYCQIFWPYPDLSRVHKDGERLLFAAQRKKTLLEQRKSIRLYWESRARLLRAVNSDRLTLAKQYDAYAYALRRIFAHIITSTGQVTFELEKRLKRIVQASYGEQADEAYAVLTTPTKEDLLMQERKAWVRPGKSPISILRHLRKYSVLLANVFSERDALSFAKKRDTELLKREIQDASKRQAALKKEKRAILGRLGSSLANEISTLLCGLGVLRLELKACWNGEAFHSLPFFKKAARLAGCSVRDFYFYYTWREVSALLHKGKPLPLSILKARKHYCLLYLNQKCIAIYNGNQTLEMKRKILGASLPDREMQSFSGAIACKGKVRGRARVVRVDSPQALSHISKSLRKGDILVTGMTNPTMMGLIRKVSGIITDEGGIACHAAIISREFGLPCIVGTHVATHVLKEGDRIELDALTGAVRKLS